MNKDQISQIPFPGNVGAIYAIPAQDWKAINTWVSTVLDYEIAFLVLIPIFILEFFLQMAASCKLWRSTTFVDITGQSGLISTFGADAVQTLQELAADLKGLNPGDPLPQGTAFHYKVRLGALATSASTYRDNVNALTPQVSAFVALNDSPLATVLSSILSCSIASLGPLQNALPLILTSWGGLSDQLSALASDKVEITTAGLLAEDIQAAITEWNSLSQTAADFNVMAHNLT